VKRILLIKEKELRNIWNRRDTQILIWQQEET